MPRPLCVLLPEVGVLSETFLRWDVCELLPSGTAVIADPPPNGETTRQPPAWDVADGPALTFAPVAGDPAPSAERDAAVVDFLDEHRVEVVLVEYLDFADRWFDLLRAHGVRVWLRGHGVDLSARLTQPYWRDAYRRYANADGILVPSSAAASVLTNLGLPPAKVHVVGYPVEAPPPRPAIQRPTVHCVAVGRLVEKKAPLLLLDAFRRAADRDPRLRLDLIGDGPLRDKVAAYVAGEHLTDRVTLHGPLPHEATLRHIRAADILLHHAVTSPIDGDAEGLPLAILEAMAAGVSPVATAHAGIPEVVADKINGRLVPEHDVAGMAHALLDLAADPTTRTRLGRAARATATARHSTDAARSTLLRLFGVADLKVRV